MPSVISVSTHIRSGAPLAPLTSFFLTHSPSLSSHVLDQLFPLVQIFLHIVCVCLTATTCPPNLFVVSTRRKKEVSEIAGDVGYFFPPRPCF